MTTYRYYRWDGSQQVFNMDADDLMNSIADDILEHGDPERALRSLFQRGIDDNQGQHAPGLRDLLERLRQQRQQQLERYNLDSVMDDIKEKLQDVIDTERKGIEDRLQDAEQQLQEAGDAADHLQAPMQMLQDRAQRNTDALDSLPESPGGQIQQLQDYDFMDSEAREKFNELLESLKQQMMQNFFQDMKQQLQDMSPQDMEGIKNMIQALNQMLRDRAMGEDPDFEGFMEQYGEYFDPNRPASLDELIEQLQQQMAAMQSLMESMSPQMRSELESMMGAAIDPQFMDELAELAGMMYDMFPFDDMAGEYPFMGEESMTLDSAMELMGELRDMDQLEQQVQQVMRNGNIEDLDLDNVEQIMGEDARRQLEQLQRLIQQLEEAGYLKRKGDRLELTPRGIRKLAQQALREVFSELKKDRMGRHEIYSRGDGGERTGETKPYEFGDPFDIDLHRTLFNSTLRNGPGTPLRISPGGLRDSSHRAHDADGDRPAHRPEPLHGHVRQLRSGQEGRPRALLAHSQPVPTRLPPHHRLLRLRHGHRYRRPRRPHMERLGLRHEHAARAHAGAPCSVEAEGRHQADSDDYRRRTHRAP